MLSDYLVPRGYNLVSPLDFRRDISRFFSELTSGGQSLAALENNRAPSVWETADEYFVELAAPGLAEDAISVELAGSELTIALRRQTESAEQTGRYWRRERAQGDETFAVAFPNPVDPDKVEARLERGILLVQVAKLEKARVRKIEVKKSTPREDQSRS